LCVRLNKQGDSSGVFSTNGPHLDDSIPSLLIDEIKADEFWWFDVYKPDMIVTEVPAAADRSHARNALGVPGTTTF
jgi:hypothetical protein